MLYAGAAVLYRRRGDENPDHVLTATVIRVMPGDTSCLIQFDPSSLEDLPADSPPFLTAFIDQNKATHAAAKQHGIDDQEPFEAFSDELTVMEEWYDEDDLDEGDLPPAPRP